MALKDWKKGNGYRWYNKDGKHYIVLTHILNGLHEGDVGVEIRIDEGNGYSKIIKEKYFGRDNNTNTKKALAYVKHYMRTQLAEVKIMIQENK